ncbi:NRDE family protein [Psychromonas sp. KJ10-2]|uniref:NRDE family protein n=1 Tax=Psychromonas sp. KJ10-2 TaxID=3391822 RepID=UPI0039B55387
MCTLTYQLTEQGYQLFFNRDEQRTRPQAIIPMLDKQLNAVYPIDPTGGGTWIATHQSGVSLALLNYYQAQINPSLKNFTSRGVIIPRLLARVDQIHQQLLSMDLSCFQAFQLCVFDSQLSLLTASKHGARQYVWDGKQLTHSLLSAIESLPVTSSGVDFETVSAYRKQHFVNAINVQTANTADYIQYHQHQGESGKCSVKMFRDDAKTVSFTHIAVNQNNHLGKKVQLGYVDYFAEQTEEKISLTF